MIENRSGRGLFGILQRDRAHCVMKCKTDMRYVYYILLEARALSRYEWATNSFVVWSVVKELRPPVAAAAAEGGEENRELGCKALSVVSHRYNFTLYVRNHIVSLFFFIEKNQHGTHLNLHDEKNGIPRRGSNAAVLLRNSTVMLYMLRVITSEGINNISFYLHRFWLG